MKVSVKVVAMRLRSALIGCILLTPLVVAGARGEELVASAATRKGGISIQLPAEWKVQSRESSHLLLVAIAPVQDADPTGEYQASLTVTVAAGSAVDGEAQQARLARDFANYHVTEKPTAISINSLSGVTFGGTFTLGSLKLRSRQYLLVQGEHLYTVTITALASRWEAHVPMIEASVGTFAVVEK